MIKEEEMFEEEKIATGDQLIEKRADSIDWALNKMLEINNYVRKENMKGYSMSMLMTPSTKHTLTVIVNIFCTKPESVKNKTNLLRILKLFNVGKFMKTTTSSGFTKLTTVYQGVRINIFTHWCFERGHVKVVKKGQRTRAVTRCTSKDEALKLAAKNGYVIEE